MLAPRPRATSDRGLELAPAPREQSTSGVRRREGEVQEAATPHVASQAESALRASEAKLRAIFDHAVDGMIAVDDLGRIELFNRTAERMFGVSAAEVLGLTMGHLFVTGDEAPAAGGEEASTKRCEATGHRRDGSSFPLEVSVSDITDGERRFAVAVLRDITERRKIESRTAAQHAITRILSHSRTVGEAARGILPVLGKELGLDVAAMWYEAPTAQALRCSAVWSADGARFQRTLRVVRRATFSRGEGFLGRVWATGELLWTDTLAADTSSERAAAAEADGLVTWILCPIAVSGLVIGVLEVASSSRLARDEDLADVLRAVGSQIGQLIERKETEDALRVAKETAEQASRAKTEFLANVSHEIRTPLNAILGVADLLWQSDLDDEQRQYLSLFRRAGANLLALVNDLLDLSKVEAGQLVLARVPFDVREVVAQALESTAVRAYEKGLEMVGSVSPRVPSMTMGDPVRLRQVLVNLLGNAAKFTERGEVVLEVDRAPQPHGPGELYFSVRDTGIGIPQDKLDSIFDRFSQVDASPTRVHSGTGLGLAICKRLVELMGGRIWADSEVGAGTVLQFTVMLDPASDEVAISARATPSRVGIELAQLRPRVLVVEDHAATRTSIAEVLRNAGCTALEAGSASLARAAIEASERGGLPFDAMLVDAKLPVADGVDLVAWLQRSQARAKSCVLLLPADAKPAEMAAVRAQGFARYLLKPAAERRVTAAVAAVSRGSARVPSVVPAPAPAAADSRALDILLVEDHPDNRLIVQSYLKDQPYRVTVAENGEAAVAKFQRERFDVVLMDMQMPVMDGYRATRKIRDIERAEGRERTPILALTAHVLNEEIERTRLAGCDAHLGKPIVKATLLAALQEHTSGEGREEPDPLAGVEPDLMDLLPGYVQNRLRDLTLCRDHLAKGRFEELRVIAHGMAGSGGAYGLEDITSIGRSLQLAARQLAGEKCLRALDELDMYLRRVHAAIQRRRDRTGSPPANK